MYDDNNPITTWKKTLDCLHIVLPTGSCQTWIDPIVPSVKDNKLILNCNSEFMKDWIESRYKKDISDMVKSFDPDLEIVISLTEKKGEDKATRSEFTYSFIEQFFVKANENLAEHNKYHDLIFAEFGKVFSLMFEIKQAQMQMESHLDDNFEGLLEAKDDQDIVNEKLFTKLDSIERKLDALLCNSVRGSTL